jgi:hypothetical protein
VSSILSYSLAIGRGVPDIFCQMFRSHLWCPQLRVRPILIAPLVCSHITFCLCSRNSTCIACRLPRSGTGFSSPDVHLPASTAPRLPASPRFAGPPATAYPSGPLMYSSQAPSAGAKVPSPLSFSAPAPPSSQVSSMPSPPSSARSHGGPPSPSYPLLTPSGRTFASGGKVQNVSSNPLMPCVMYWPDNEPFPEPGQIRPVASASIQHPPILNTGNRGPIEHQPGDWICQKCNYLNWRRRKVCQTCFPCMLVPFLINQEYTLISCCYRCRRKRGLHLCCGPGRENCPAYERA